MKKLQPDSEIKLWEKIAEHCDVVAEIIVRVDGRRLVSRRDLRRIWACTDEAIKGYVKKGMPKSELSVPSMAIYDLATVNAWREANVDSKRGMAAAKLRREKEEGLPPATSEDAEIDSVPGGKSLSQYAIAEAIAESERAVENATITKLKRQILDGSLIDSETLDITLAEQAVIYTTNYVNDKKLLPIQLEQKSRGEIRQFLDQHYSNRMSDLRLLIEKVYDCDESLHEVIQAILEAFIRGETPSKLIEVIG
jgi:hypothetical protein